MSSGQLCDVAHKKMKIEGNDSGAKIIIKAFDDDSVEILKNIKNSSITMTHMTPEEALELIISTNMTKAAYQEMRLRAQRHNHDLYPAYKNV